MKELAAVERTSSPTAQTDSEALKLYPLYPYLQAARLRRALAGAGSLDSIDERAATFVTYYDREPVGRNLRRDWLSSLAAREQWQRFLEFYSAEIKDDTLRCQSFTARIATGRTENLGDEISRRVAHAAQPAGVRNCIRMVAGSEPPVARSHRAARAPCAQGRQCCLCAAAHRASPRRTHGAAPAMGLTARESSSLDRCVDRCTRNPGRSGGVARRLDTARAHESRRGNTALR